MKRSILLIDDDALVRRALGDLLKLEGFRVLTAENGKAGLKLVSERKIDLTILDLKLPDAEGIDVLVEIRKIAPQSHVIILTGHGSVQSAIEALHLKVDDYILKRPGTDELLASIRKSLESLPLPEDSEQRAARLPEKPSPRAQTGPQGQSPLSIGEPALKNRPAGEGDGKPTIYSSAEGIKIDLSRRTICWGEKVQNLTPAETRLMQVFLESGKAILGNRDLVRLAQGYDTKEWEAPDVIRPLISRLRNKLDRFPGGEAWIVNIRGSGYSFEGEFEPVIQPVEKK